MGVHLDLGEAEELVCSQDTPHLRAESGHNQENPHLPLPGLFFNRHLDGEVVGLDVLL